MTDSPAFYEERIRLLQAENQQLRDALRELSEGVAAFFESANQFGIRLQGVAAALEETLGLND